MWHLFATSRMKAGFGKPGGGALGAAGASRGTLSLGLFCDKLKQADSICFTWSHLVAAKGGKKIIFFFAAATSASVT